MGVLRFLLAFSVLTARMVDRRIDDYRHHLSHGDAALPLPDKTRQQKLLTSFFRASRLKIPPPLSTSHV
jgi:hypothetical protein